MKKKTKVVVLIVVILIVIGIIVYIKIYNNKIKNISKHYNEIVIVDHNSNIYDKNKNIVGNLFEGFSFKLDKKNKNSDYFKIKNTNYYVYYKDVDVIDKKIDSGLNKNYIVFNKNIITKNNTKFYIDDKNVLTIKESINLPIQYFDDKFYYVYYFSHLLKVNKEDVSKVIDNNNTNTEETKFIPVINYNNIYDKEVCNNVTCISLDKFKEHIGYLNDNEFYTITIDEYKLFLDKKIRLRKNALLLTTTNNNDVIKNWNNNSEYKVEYIFENLNLKFKNSNKKSFQDSNKLSIDRYNIKNITTLDNFKKMVRGDEVNENVVFQKNINEQSIPVLNYHFFYDPKLGESCNESICLDVNIFRKQLDYLKNNGYKTLKMEEFKDWMYGDVELPLKSVLITVDDGAMGTGKHNGNKLIPILEEYNMNATLFLITGWWDVSNYRSKNLDIQSHSHDMHLYGDCNRGQVVCSSKGKLTEDLKKSLTIVDNNNSFCFPFYSYSDKALEVIKDTGFKLAFVGGNRNAKRSDNKYLIPRYPIQKSNSITEFINIVK